MDSLANNIEEEFVTSVESGLIQCLKQVAANCDTTKVMVALSGGPDSTALVYALKQIQEKMQLQLSICHVNHHLRGDESDADQKYCESLSQHFSLPIQIQNAESKKDYSSEETLRDNRYELLAKAAQRCGAKLICLGHTLDDQVETMLFRLFRGTGPQGLLGMEPVRNLDNDLFLVRPMLGIRRKQCLDYLKCIGAKPRHDSSNDQTNYTRNYLRKEVIPLIENRFGDFQMRVDQLRKIMDVEDDFLLQLTEQALQNVEDEDDTNIWSAANFFQLPEALARRVIVQAMTEREIEPSFEFVEKILACQNLQENNWALSLNGQWDIRLDGAHIKWIDKQASRQDQNVDYSWQQELKIPGVNLIASRNQALKIESLEKLDTKARPIKFPAADANEALVDLTQVTLPLVVRYRQPGDLMQPFGMEQQVKLKKYLHTHKSDKPADKSSSGSARILVIADQMEVIWIPGIGLSNKVRVSNRPSHKLSLIPLAPDSMPFA